MENVPKINWPATKDKFEEIYKQSGVAHCLRVSGPMISMILAGDYPHMKSKGAHKFIDWLREHQVLVVEEARNKAA